YDLGPATKAFTDFAVSLAKPYGITLAGNTNAKINATDWSAVITALRAMNADFVLAPIFQFDQGYLAKQYKAAGIGKPIFFPEFLGPVAKVGGAAYNGDYFASDDFNAAHPTNPWAQIFVKQFLAEYGNGGEPGATPDFYSAGFYEATFTFWSLYRRVAAKGGNV